MCISDFVIAKREKVAVIGPSGSGKTTLLNLVAGICVPDSGTITVGNERISNFSDARRRDFRITRIGFVFQDFELLDYLNVLDNILHPYRITGALKMDEAVRQRALALAGELGLDGRLQRQSTDLSQGEKQRTAICRALLPGPQIILADEATVIWTLKTNAILLICCSGWCCSTRPRFWRSPTTTNCCRISTASLISKIFRAVRPECIWLTASTSLGNTSAIIVSRPVHWWPASL